VTLDELMRVVERSPRVAASEREVDMARADRAAAGALPNPTLSFSSARPSSGERTIFDANSQQQAAIELPVPIFGQRGARMKAADLQIGRAESQLRLTLADTKRLAGLEFVRLLAAQEALAARRAALADVERIRGLVAGREQSGMASRYDLARADAELALSRLGAQRAGTELAEHAAALAALANAPEWRPQAVGSLSAFSGEMPGGDVQASPALRVAQDETSAAEARVEVARRERFPVPSVQLGRTWTSGPFGAANYFGVASEIPILDTRRALEDKALAEHAAARERERAAYASVRSDYLRLQETQAVRREALARFERDVSDRQGAFLEMAESAYRLGRGSLFELLDARRTQLEAAIARVELAGALAETQIELRALLGGL
jgi:cobalt-zinc-cadmium efflux system outer membrane protein